MEATSQPVSRQLAARRLLSYSISCNEAGPPITHFPHNADPNQHPRPPHSSPSPTSKLSHSPYEGRSPRPTAAAAATRRRPRGGATQMACATGPSLPSPDTHAPVPPRARGSPPIRPPVSAPPSPRAWRTGQCAGSAGPPQPDGAQAPPSRAVQPIQLCSNCSLSLRPATPTPTSVMVNLAFPPRVQRSTPQPGSPVTAACPSPIPFLHYFPTPIPAAQRLLPYSSNSLALRAAVHAFQRAPTSTTRRPNR